MAAPPPVAPRRPHWVMVGNIPGGGDRGEDPMDPPVGIQDDLFWLRNDDRKDPDVIAHLEAENRYTDSAMGSFQPQADSVYQELKGHMMETDVTPPLPWKQYEYYSRNEAGKGYTIHCRRPKGDTSPPMESPEYIFLDENVIADHMKTRGFEHCDINYSMSLMQTLAVLLIDKDGSEVYEAFFFDPNRPETALDAVIKGEPFATRLDGDCIIGGQVEGSETVFFTRKDDVKRPYQLYKYADGAETLLLEELDERFWVSKGMSSCEGFVFANVGSSEMTEVTLYGISPDTAHIQGLCVQPKIPDVLCCSVDVHVNGRGERNIYKMSNEGKHRNFELLVGRFRAGNLGIS